MKKIIFAGLILLGLNAGAFAQTAPAKKEPAKMQVVQKTTPQKNAKVVPIKAKPVPNSISREVTFFTSSFSISVSNISSV